MNLFPMLSARAEANEPIRVAQLGAGRFDSMFLSQAHMTPGLNIAGLADLDPARARQRLKDAGWEDGRFAAGSIDDTFATGATFVTDDAEAIVAGPRIDVIIEAAGDPANGVRFARQAFSHGKSVVMVNVEADALVGPLLAREARKAGVIYSLAWGEARPHRRTCRLGAHLRLPDRRRRQGHALPAELSRLHA